MEKCISHRFVLKKNYYYLGFTQHASSILSLIQKISMLLIFKYKQFLLYSVISPSTCNKFTEAVTASYHSTTPDSQCKSTIQSTNGFKKVCKENHQLQSQNRVLTFFSIYWSWNLTLFVFLSIMKFSRAGNISRHRSKVLIIKLVDMSLAMKKRTALLHRTINVGTEH